MKIVKNLLYLMIVLLICSLIIPSVLGACTTYLNCNVKINPDNPNISIPEFSGKCGGITQNIINKGNSEIVLNKFYFQDKEYYCLGSYSSGSWIHCHLSNESIGNESFVIPLNYEGFIYFPMEDIWTNFTGDPKIDVFILAGPSINISGSIQRGVNVFRCNDAEKTMVDITLSIGLAILTILIITILIGFVKIKRLDIVALILGIISFCSIWSVFFQPSFFVLPIFFYSGILSIAAIIIGSVKRKKTMSKAGILLGIVTLVMILFLQNYLSGMM